jgi:hypothetical protein
MVGEAGYRCHVSDALGCDAADRMKTTRRFAAASVEHLSRRVRQEPQEAAILPPIAGRLRLGSPAHGGASRDEAGQWYE